MAIGVFLAIGEYLSACLVLWFDSSALAVDLRCVLFMCYVRCRPKSVSLSVCLSFLVLIETVLCVEFQIPNVCHWYIGKQFHFAFTLLPVSPRPPPSPWQPLSTLLSVWLFSKRPCVSDVTQYQSCSGSCHLA